MRNVSIKRVLVFWLVLTLAAGFALPHAPPMEAAQAPPAGDNLTSEALKQRARDAYLKLPLYFTANQGQMDESVGYYIQGGGHSIYFTAEEMVMALDETVLRMRFVGANATPPLGVERTEAKVNYLIGNDPAKWQTDIPTYGEVVYHDLYPGIDLRYGGQRGALKYTLVVQPGADVSQIRLAYGGAAGLRLDGAGNLLILAGGSELKDTRPYAYQEIGGRRVEVETEFVLHGVRTCGFAVRDSYDSRHPLIIDPTLLYSTYLGGSSNDEGNGIAVDGAGNAYVTGYTNSGDFPTRNAYDTTPGGQDAFVAKIDTTESGNPSLIYSTYLGGDLAGDWGNGIAVDGAGQAYVTGQTDSSDFPTTAGAFDTTCGTDGTCNFSGSSYLSDVFVTKLNAAGNALLYSTYLGGSDYDEGNGIAVDGAGHAYVTGETESTDFPTQDPYQAANAGNDDAFVSKIDPTQSGAASLIYSTYLGGSDYDYGNGIAVDGAGHAYVTGYTRSNNFPTQNPYQGDQGDSDVFVTQVITDSGVLNLGYSTYLGGSSYDTGYGIAVDGDGNAYVTGQTQSGDFPTQNPYQGDQGYNDAFVTKVVTASGVLNLGYSTYLGGSSYDYGRGIAVDGDGHAYVTGYTQSNNFPTQNAYDNLLGGSQDIFVTKLDAAGNALGYSTYLGGTGTGGQFEEGRGIAVDGAGQAYVAGSTTSFDFPTQNAYDNSHGSGSAVVAKPNGGEVSDVFVSKFGPPPVLSIGKSDFPDPVAAGGLLTYTIVVSETGGLVNASGVQVTDTVPANTTCCASIGQGGTLSDGEVVWSNKTIARGSSITLTFVVTVNLVPSSTIVTNDAYRVVSSTLGVTTGLGSAVTTTVGLGPFFLPLIQKSSVITP